MTETTQERQLNTEIFATLVESVGCADEIRAARTIFVKPNLTSRVADPSRFRYSTGLERSMVSFGQRIEDARDPASVIRGLARRGARRLKRGRAGSGR